MTQHADEPPPVGPNLVAKASRARDELLAMHSALIAASEEWGLRKNHPEGRFVSSLIATQLSFADMVVGFAFDLESIIEQMRETAQAELARHKSAREETRALIGQTRGVIRDFDIEKARMADDMLARAVPKLVKGVRDAVEVREVWISRGAMLRQAVIGGVVAVALVVGGYSWRMVQVWDVSDAALRNSEGIEVCKATSHWVDPQGHRLCRLDAFTAREADAK